MSAEKTIALAVHGGAGPDSEFVRNNQRLYRSGLAKALESGYRILHAGGTALDAVEQSVRVMEDDPVFNAGRGAALNSKGEVQMYASIMDGRDLSAGAACLLKRVKNPVSFVRKILEHGKVVFLGAQEAEAFAQRLGMEMKDPHYFITEHQQHNFVKERQNCASLGLPYNPMTGGTVGAVACDRRGELAAATSTGGTMYSQPGRIGDSSLIGIGTYADNNACAVSCTGDGEALIKHVLAHSVVVMKRASGANMQAVCDEIVLKGLSHVKADIGLISVSPNGEIGICCNTERMHRAWISEGERPRVAIYPGETAHWDGVFSVDEVKRSKE